MNSKIQTTLPHDLRRIVIKISSSIVYRGNKRLQRYLSRIAVDIAEIKKQRGIDVIIVASGAIALGRTLFDSKDNTQEFYNQAAASIGQVQLISLYEKCFRKEGLKVAQFLLTRRSVSEKGERLEFSNNLEALLDDRSVIPVLNENDPIMSSSSRTHAKKENDKFAAIVAMSIGADLLIYLSEVQGLFKNFSSSEQELVCSIRDSHELDAITSQILSSDKDMVSNGKGGIEAKVLATKFALIHGLHTYIGSGLSDHPLGFLLNGLCAGTLCFSENYHTRLKAIKIKTAEDWKSRLLLEEPKGWVVANDGACVALVFKKGSLLDVGVTEVSSEQFEKGDPIAIRDKLNRLVAKGYALLDGKALLKQVRKKQSGTKRDTRIVVDRHNMLIMPDNPWKKNHRP